MKKQNIRKHTVTIGIPAFNEQVNLLNLLNDLRSQKQINLKIAKIIVACDGSGDKTVETVRKQRSLPIQVINGKFRIGKPARLNEIIKKTNSDILVLLDADIRLRNSDFLTSLTAPLLGQSKVALTSGYAMPFKPVNFVEKIANAGITVWEEARKRVKFADMYNCEGQVRALKKELYTKIKFPNYSADDVYTYLACIALGYKFVSVKRAVVLYKLPSTLGDYLNQQRRYLQSQRIQEQNFGREFVSDHYVITFRTKIAALIRCLVSNPVYTSLYLAFVILPKLLAQFSRQGSEATWNILKTTKKLGKTKTDKKRVIISSYDDIKNPYYGGGGAIAIHEISKRLAGKYDITVITNNYPFGKDAVLDKVKYKRIGFANAGPRLGQLIFQLVLPFYVIRDNYDLWLESFTPPFSTSFLQIFSRKPVVGLVHMLSAQDMRRKFKLPFNLVEDFGLKTYKHFIVTSDTMNKKIAKINPSTSIKTISNGIDVELLLASVARYPKYRSLRPKSRENKRKTQSRDSRVLLFMGRIEVNQKGLDLLLEAFNLIKNKISYRLVIAGTGTNTELNKLRVHIRTLGLSDRVDLVGRVEGDKKQKLLRNSLLIAIPSRFETFSLMALEALAIGTPMVCFDIEGLKWIPKSTCIKVASLDSKSLSKAILKLVNNSSLRKKLSGKGREFAKGFTWEKMAQEYGAYIENLTNGKYNHA